SSVGARVVVDRRLLDHKTIGGRALGRYPGLAPPKKRSNGVARSVAGEESQGADGNIAGKQISSPPVSFISQRFLLLFEPKILLWITQADHSFAVSEFAITLAPCVWRHPQCRWSSG